jgi:IclR family acetate operon transcriptional repressor
MALTLRKQPLSRGPVQRDALGKALQVMSRMVEDSSGTSRKEWGVRQLAQELQWPPATLFRALSSLMKHGFVQQSVTSGQYQIGAEFYRLALKVQGDFALRTVGVPIMRELVAKCNEAAFLGYYEPSRLQMMFLTFIDSSHPIRYIVPMNEWIPVHAGASGLAIMAFLPEAERRAIIKKHGLPRITETTITNRVGLEEELARIRARGYSFSHGQRTKGSVAVGAPIWGPTGNVIGELNLSVPENRFDEKMIPTYAKLVIRYAQQIMEKLGAKAPPEYQSRRAHM